jgi:hypothetical protein
MRKIRSEEFQKNSSKKSLQSQKFMFNSSNIFIVYGNLNNNWGKEKKKIK